MSRKRTSTREEPLGLRSAPKTVSQRQTFVVGDKVQAQWKDRRWYEGFVIKVDKNAGTFIVKFIEDKLEKEVKLHQIRYAVKKETLDLFDEYSSSEKESSEENNQESNEENDDEEEESTDDVVSLTQYNIKSRNSKSNLVSMKTPPTPSKLKQSVSKPLIPVRQHVSKRTSPSKITSPTKNDQNNKNNNVNSTSSIRITRSNSPAQARSKAVQSRSLRSNSAVKDKTNLRSQINNNSISIESDENDDNQEEKEEEEQLTQERTYIFKVHVPVKKKLKAITIRHDITRENFEEHIIPLMNVIT